MIVALTEIDLIGPYRSVCVGIQSAQLTLYMPTRNAVEWFNTCLGQYLLEREQNYYDQAVANVFGYNAMQIGFPQYHFLRANRMPLQFCVAGEAGSAVRAAPDFLPIETNSIDLVLLPHVLEFSSNPHQILREVQRVLMPEGHVIVWWLQPPEPLGRAGTFRDVLRSRRQFSVAGQFHRPARLKDWLTLLDFEITEDRLCCYTPPFSQEKWLNRFISWRRRVIDGGLFPAGYISSRRSNAFMECV